MLELPQIYAENIGAWPPELLYYSVATLKIALVSFVLAVAIGLLLALCRISTNSLLRGFATVGIETARGLPIVVLLYIVYFVPPQIAPNLNWQWFTDFTGAVVGLALHGGALLAEVFRSGIEALHKGQREAALTLGMTPTQSMTYIILPQATRIVLPPLAADGAHPILAIAEIVGAAALDEPIGVGLAPQALVHAERHVDAAAQFEHVLHGIDGHRHLDEIEIVALAPAPQQSNRLGLAPGLIDVDADETLFADGAPERLEHGLLPLLVDAGLDVIGAIAAPDPVLALALDLARGRPFHIVVVIDGLAHGAAEHAVERLAAGLSAQVPQGRRPTGSFNVF